MNNPFTIIPRYLRNPGAFFESVSRGERIAGKILALALSAVTFLASYGFVTGLSHSPQQALSTAVKMPILFVVTIFFCLPAFYFFSLVLGTRLGLAQVTAVVLAGIGVTSFLLLGLSPVTLFFVITSSNYPFFKLLAAAFVAISGCIGMYLLWRGMMALDSRPGDSSARLRQPLLFLWFALYAFMGSQMTWRLSPFVGDPSQPFVLIQPSRDNFYVDVLKAFIDLTGMEVSLAATSTILVGAMCLLPLLALLFGIGLAVDRRHRPAPRGQAAPQAQGSKT